MPTRRRRAVAVAAVLLPLTLAGCGLDLLSSDEPTTLPSPTLSSSPLPTAEPETPAPAVEDLERYYTQDVTWEKCRQDKECARVNVPLDYSDPGGEAIELALLRVPAASAKQRVGSLVVNPGGPGASGIDYASSATAYFGPELVQAFDIVGFDPRGVGESTPVDCVSDERLDEFVATDPDPDTPAEVDAADELVAEMGKGCVANSGDLASHVSTVEAAKDIDIIRELVGDRRLSYFGASYGTLLGATYADLFPNKVGRMVLDGALDPSLSAERSSLVQAKGFETALRAYVGYCVDRGDCFLGDTVDEGTRTIRTFLDDVEASPIAGSAGRQLEVGNAVLGIWTPLYSQGYWPLLDAALKSAFDGNGAALLALSDAYVKRGPTGYVNNSLEALYAINCLDQDDAVQSSEVSALVPAFERASPTFGKIFAYGLSACASWPVDGTPQPDVLDAPGAAPILVIGTSRDPATPLVWAEALADQLSSGVLVRRDGDGHTGYKAGNDCVDDVVESYLVSGKAPRRDVSC